MNPRVLLVFNPACEESSAMLKGIARHARLHKPWSFLLDDGMRAGADPSWFRGQKFDGVISRAATPALAKACAQQKIPLVDIDGGETFPGVPQIRADHAAIGRLGAAHVIERGFQSLGFCGYENEAWSRERREGFSKAVDRAKQKCDTLDTARPDDAASACDARQTAAISQWLRSLPKPAAVMACCDAQALLVIAAAQEAGLHVPEEIAVLGAGHNPLRCDLSAPALSSVATDAFQSGGLAAECLAALMAGKKPESADIRVAPAGVVLRESTDLRAINDSIVAGAINCIRRRACRGLTVEQVLRQVRVSRSVLEKKFRAHLSHSPQAEIRRVQVARISRLLCETDFTLKKIAALTGFEHVEYLCVVFKRLTGQAPGSYRKKCAQKTTVKGIEKTPRPGQKRPKRK